LFVDLEVRLDWRKRFLNIHYFDTDSDFDRMMETKRMLMDSVTSGEWMIPTKMADLFLEKVYIFP
jgi:hypothetical protein